MRIIGNDPSVPRQTQKVASGAITNGKPVVVNTDGTAGLPFSAKTIFNEALSQTTTIGTNGSGTFVIIWVNTAPSYQGYAVAGTISGNTVTLGTPVLYVSEGNITTDNTSVVYDPDEDKFVLVYSDGGAGNYLTARVASVSGTTITFGTAVVIQSGNVASSSAVYDTTADKVVVAYRGHTNDYLTGIVGTVSGTSISFGSKTTLASKRPYYIKTVYDSNADKTAVFYEDSADTNDGYYVVCTVSGTGISAGTTAAFHAANTTNIAAAYDSTAQKIVITYADVGNNSYGTAIVGTISGTSMSFGSEVVFSGTSYVSSLSVSYDSTNNKTFVFYDKADSAATGIIGTVSGTSISFGSESTLTSGNISYTDSTFDSSAGKALVVYRDIGNSSYGTLFAVDTSLATGNFTSENYIGMSGGPAFQTGEAGSTGTAVSFESGSTQTPKVVFDSNSNRIVIAYIDGGNSDKGTAVVGTVSGTSISFGSLVIYEQGGTANIDAVFDSSNNKVVIVYQDNGDSGRGKGIVGTVDSSDNSISFGSATQFNSGANNAYNVSAAFDSSNNKVVIAYRDNGNSDYGTAVVGTVSGTSISFGTPVVFESANSSQTAVAFDSSNNKVVIAYRDNGNSDQGTAIVGTVSGTSISFGSAAIFNAGETSQIFSTFDPVNNKVVIAYRDSGNSDLGTAIVGTVSGTSISFGSEVVFNDTGNTQGIGITFDSNANKIVISYEDRGNSDKGEFVTGTVSGTSISFGTPEGFSGSNAVFQTDCGFDSNANKVVIAYANDTDSSDRGEAIVTNISTIATTRGQVADGGHVLIDTQGAISDNQIGLTAGQSYFVQSDGTLSTTADDPSVFAGTAVSATKLIVKG